ncbi:MAG: hypothetical protein B6I38_10355 [Anaerolineaceae bacterium 4572_5.1]|nr:MAG: hypothetical protein B6I38_10355 [Anaerolineaceae bacterium 4572_5.1]
MPERIEYWGIPWKSPEILVYTVMFLAAIIMLFRLYQKASLWWKVGRPEARWDKLHLRVWRVIKYAVVQTRVLRQKFPGIMHVGLAWGFFVFFAGTALATINDHFFFKWIGDGVASPCSGRFCVGVGVSRRVGSGSTLGGSI